MAASYPIHPEVFDRLYEDWASRERFQRTRDVLRLMAKAIHEIWQSDEQGLLIMPGSIPFEAAPVRNELTHYLGDQWNSVIDTDVKDASTGGIAVYIDALSRMRDTLTFLYSTGQERYWFAVQANLNRTVADRIGRLAAAEVQAEVISWLKRWPTRGSEVTGVHLGPQASGEVHDEDRVRMVVLDPRFGHLRGDAHSEAIAEAATILENHGPSPRRYRNILLFLASDAAGVANLETEARRYLA